VSRWRWRVTAWYGPKATPPRQPGRLAIQTVHATESSRDHEESILRRREDIGEVKVEEVGPDGLPLPLHR
jgi:hypothetical protein